MHEIVARNVNEALREGLWWLKANGVVENSRNGEVIVSRTPVVTKYMRPSERVLFSQVRDANIFFHFFESLWMLAGRNDLRFPLYFNSGFANYSDDGETLHGAYGHRWRNHFGRDQLMIIIDELKKNPNSRRCVLSMWDPITDLGMEGKDFPCNTQIFFKTTEGRLDMTVINRSNDIVWGAYGANAFHMSFLHEVICLATGIPMGVYYQFSNNFHLYTSQHGAWVKSPEIVGCRDLYSDLADINPYPIITTSMDIWMNDLNLFFENPIRDPADYTDNFFISVVDPLYHSWAFRKGKRIDLAREWLKKVKATDIKLAATEWMDRRDDAAEQVNEGRPA